MAQRTVLMIHPHSDLYGSDRVFIDSVRAMVGAGWRVVVTIPAEGRIGPSLRATGAELVICPAPVLRKEALRPAGFVRFARAAARFVRPAVRLLRETDPDVVYVNTVATPGWALFARLARRPLLIHIHEAEDAFPRVAQIGLALPLLTADVLISNSKATSRSIGAALPILRRRIRLIYNAVEPPAEVTGHTAPHTPVRLLVVARLSPRKGVDIAVDAAAELHRRGRDVELRLVGSIFAGYEWFENQLRHQVSEAGLGERVQFAGFQNDVWAAYAGADIALVPSRWEPFGNTAVEAQLAGVPLVVTDVQGLPETVDHGQCALVVAPDDAAGLATAIESIIDDWPAALARAELGQKFAGERFGPQRYGSEVVELVTSLAERGRGSRRREKLSVLRGGAAE